MKNITKTAAGIGAAMGVCARDGYLYVISNRDDGVGGSLSVYSLENAVKPCLVGRLTGVGNSRQIAMRGNTVLITAREDGLVIVDVSKPSEPRMLVRYDTVEFATALCVGSHYAFVGCRQYGVEAIDISDPSRPRHVSYMKAGEVQSLAYENGLLATGTWGAMVSNLFDVSDISHPRHLAQMELGGRGDGVFIRGNLLFAATGQFPRGFKDYHDPSAPGYGMGNGLDIFDITDREHPVLLSRTNIGYATYYPSFDMWSVIVSGGYAYVGHTWNGVFVFDISDPREPRVVCEVNFPIPVGDKNYFTMITPEVRKFHPAILSFDSEKEARSPVTDIAVCDGYLYASTGKSDLYVLASDVFSAPECAAGDVDIRENGSFYDGNTYNKLSELELFRVAGANIHTVVPANGRLYAAGGHAGILALDADGNLLFSHRTEAAVLDIGVFGNYLFAAETNRAMSVWRICSDRLEYVAETGSEGYSVRQLVVSENGWFVFLHIGGEAVWIINVTDPTHPCIDMRDKRNMGLIYERQISTAALDGRFYCAHWNDSYVQWYDTAGEHAVKLDTKLERLVFPSGVAPFGSADAPTRFLYTLGKGYALADISDEGNMITPEKIYGVPCIGKPVILGDVMYTSDKMSGAVRRIDIADITAPALTDEYRFASYIGNVTSDGEYVYIAAGEQGYARRRI